MSVVNPGIEPLAIVFEDDVSAVFKFDTTLLARMASPLSVTTPTARPFSMMTSLTDEETRMSTPRSIAAFAMA